MYTRKAQKRKGQLTQGDFHRDDKACEEPQQVFCLHYGNISGKKKTSFAEPERQSHPPVRGGVIADADMLTWAFCCKLNLSLSRMLSTGTECSSSCFLVLLSTCYESDPVLNPIPWAVIFQVVKL